jgi:hypothetical protein
LLREATSKSRELPGSLRPAALAMGEAWLYDRLSESFYDVDSTADFDAAYAQLEAAMAEPGNSSNLTAALRRMQQQVTSWRQRLPPGKPRQATQTPGLRDYWQSILDDPGSSEEERENAQRALRYIAE